MSARRKLNVVYVQGGLIVAGALGVLSRSWTVFGVTLAVVIGGGLHGGAIRPRGRRR